jgi:nucleoside 2-deoxyribosyltransferase
MGYLFGRGFPVWGYTSHAADYATRVVDDGNVLVEAFGLADNLMLEGPMLRREGTIVRVPESGPDATAAFAAFAIVVRVAAAELVA